MLSVEKIEAGYGRTTVLFGVSIEVPDDALVCVMGRNGVGKTTLIKTIMGVIKPRSGRVVLDGRDMTNLSPNERVRAGVAYVPQGRASFPGLTVRENLQVVIEGAGRDHPRGTIDEALDLFPRLKPFMGRQAGFLSGGQAQQLAIARALLTRPRLLLLDEPTEGLQPSVIIEIEDIVTQLNAATGLAIVLVEQYMEFALRLADRFVVLDAGHVAVQGETEGLDRSELRGLLSI